MFAIALNIKDSLKDSALLNVPSPQSPSLVLYVSCQVFSGVICMCRASLIQMTPDNNTFNRNIGLELPGCWLSMLCANHPPGYNKQ